jgi:ethanolamine ammonia-lyase large subunit
MRPAGVALSGVTIASKATSAVEPIAIKEAKRGEDVFAYVTRVKGGFDQTFYQQVIGASNAFKEGDVALGAGGGKWLIFIEPQA